MTPEVTRIVGGQLWHVDSRFAERLFPADGGGLPEALAAGRLEPVKRGHARRTCRVSVGGARLYVKQYHGPRGRSHARREWLIARRAFRDGLSTPHPVAALWKGGAAFVTADAGPAPTLNDLVTEHYFDPAGAEPPVGSAIEPSAVSTAESPGPGTTEPPYPGHRPPELVRLYRCRRLRTDARLPDGRPVPTPRELARMVAELLIELHSLGLRHRDLHPGNLLVVPGDDGPRLQVLDLVELEERPGRATVVDHLVQLNHFFKPLATRAERFRVLRLLGARGLRFAADAALLEQATWVYRRGFYRGRDKRCRRHGKYFRRVRAGSLSGFAVADLADHLPEARDDLLRAFQIREPVKTSRREVSGFGVIAGRRVFLKHDTRAGWRGAGRPWPAVVEHWLRGTRQRRAWRIANALLVRGIGTARPLAWCDVAHGPLGREGILVCEALDGWTPLDQALPDQRGPRRARLVETVAREVRRMHDCGLSNRDLKAQNILVRYDGRRWRVALVDVVGVRRHRRPVVRIRRMQNLMRLAFSWSGVGVSGQASGLARTDRLRFLKTYLGPHVRQTITVRGRKRPARGQVEWVRSWWRGINFALGEKADRQKR